VEARHTHACDLSRAGPPTDRAVKALAVSLPKTARGRGDGPVRTPAGARPEELLLIEWPKNEPEPTKYWLSTLPDDISFARLVDLAKLRWRIERDYQDLKRELGLGHYEGRGWRGFHHHATLCIAAYGFLIAERAAIPP
jgi:SRSO17 transposase